MVAAALIICIVLIVGGYVYKVSKAIRERSMVRHGVSLFTSGKFEECRIFLQTQLMIYPNSQNAYLLLGNVGLELDDIDLAKKSYEKVLSVNATSDKALTGMGVVMRSKQRFGDAEDFYYKALRVNPNSSKAKSSLMLLEMYKGNHDVAIALGEDSVRCGLKEVESGVLANLVLAYHFSNSHSKRDAMLSCLTERNYKDISYIKMVLHGKINFYDMMEIPYE